jgi:hypothetical protein
MMPSVVISTHSSSQPGRISPSHTSPKALPEATDYSKAEYTNTQQDLPVGDNYFTNSRHERILAQVLVGLFFSKLAI